MRVGEAMELFLFCVLSLILQVSGESLIQALKSNLELTTLFHYVNASSSLTTLYSSIGDFTLLAPSNDAFNKLNTIRNGLELSPDELEGLLRYHILVGNHTTKSWSSRSQFVPTYLTDAKYTNVTGGQVVELVFDGQGNPQIISFNKTVSSITAPNISCTNGTIQIVSNVLQVPSSLGTLLLSAPKKFNFFAAGLVAVGILTSDFAPVAEEINATDVTFFIPNSAAALEAFTEITSNVTDVTKILNILQYHIVLNDLVYSTGLEDGMQLISATGKNLTISAQNGNIFVNQALITTPDYMVSNGVVHIINGLLDDIFDASPTTPTPSPSSLSKAASSGLSPRSKIAIGVTIPLLILALIIGFLAWYFKYYKRQRQQIPPAAINAPELKQSFFGHSNSVRDNKVNRVLGEDLQLDSPFLSNEKFMRASRAELDAAPVRHPSAKAHSVQVSSIQTSSVHDSSALSPSTITPSTTAHAIDEEMTEYPYSEMSPRRRGP